MLFAASVFQGSERVAVMIGGDAVVRLLVMFAGYVLPLLRQYDVTAVLSVCSSPA